MVISYNQNLHLRIQCRKIQKQNDNSLHYIFYIIENPHNNMDMEINVEACTSMFDWKKLHWNYKKIPCSMEMKIKTTK